MNRSKRNLVAAGIVAGLRRFIKAQSGNEALGQVLKHENIGLIMLDVQMPDMAGFEVARSQIECKNKRYLYHLCNGFEQGRTFYTERF